MNLCPESAYRASLSDSDFWSFVLTGERPVDYVPDEYDFIDDEVPALDSPCEVCGSRGACGYDSEGRAMIHSTGGSEGDA